jgi:outer membrane protein assembly factor BamB/TolB-like protein
MRTNVLYKVIFVLVLLLLCFGVYAQEFPLVAVAPFVNATGDADSDYIGFQIAEIFATALSSFPEITVVERSRLADLLREQELQLSGLTRAEGAVTVGRILNAKQLLCGSFLYESKGSVLVVNARLLDAQSGKILWSQTLDGSREEGTRKIIRKLALQLSDEGFKLPITFDVEAALTVMNEWEDDSATHFLRALHASYQGSDEDAVALLQQSMNEALPGGKVYGEALKTLQRTVLRIEGKSLYVSMLTKQAETNERLAQEAEALSQYRARFKLLFALVLSQLTPDALQISVGKRERIQMDSVSATIDLPSRISVEIRPEVLDTINRLLDEKASGILKRQSDETVVPVGVPKAPSLLPGKDTQELFRFDLDVKAEYLIQFVDRSGNVVYQLRSNTLSSHILKDPKLAVSREAEDGYREEGDSSGITRNRDGSVEISARRLKDIFTIHVMLDRDSIRRQISCPVWGDDHWHSLLAHTFLQRSILIDSSTPELPQLKKLLITDRFISLGPVHGIPLLPEGRILAGYTDLIAVAYWGEPSSGIVTGYWSGAIEGESPIFRGSLDNGLVLTFLSPARGYDPISESVTFTLSFNDSEISHSVEVSDNSITHNPNPQLYDVEQDDVGLIASGFRGIYRIDPSTSDYQLLSEHSGRISVIGKTILLKTSELSAIDGKTGTFLWSTKTKNSILTVTTDGRDVFAVVGTGLGGPIKSFEVSTGIVIWTSSYQTIPVNMVYADGVLLVNNKNGILAGVSADSGRLLWEKQMRFVKPLLGAGLLGFIKTGLHDRDGSLVAVNARTGRERWTISEGIPKSLVVDDGNAYVLGSDKTYCIDIESGNVKWRSTANGEIIVSHESIVYITGNQGTFALDSITGAVVWRAQGLRGRDIYVSAGYLFIVCGGDGFFKIKL